MSRAKGACKVSIILWCIAWGASNCIIETPPNQGNKSSFPLGLHQIWVLHQKRPIKRAGEAGGIARVSGVRDKGVPSMGRPEPAGHQGQSDALAANVSLVVNHPPYEFGARTPLGPVGNNLAQYVRAVTSLFARSSFQCVKHQVVRYYSVDTGG